MALGDKKNSPITLTIHANGFVLNKKITKENNKCRGYKVHYNFTKLVPESNGMMSSRPPELKLITVTSSFGNIFKYLELIDSKSRIT